MDMAWRTKGRVVFPGISPGSREFGLRPITKPHKNLKRTDPESFCPGKKPDISESSGLHKTRSEWSALKKSAPSHAGCAIGQRNPPEGHQNGKGDKGSWAKRKTIQDRKKSHFSARDIQKRIERRGRSGQ